MGKISFEISVKKEDVKKFSFDICEVVDKYRHKAYPVKGKKIVKVTIEELTEKG